MRFGDNLKSLTIETNVAATTTEPSYSVDYTDREPNRVLHADGVGALTNTTAVTVVPAMNVGTLERAITNVTVYNRDTTAKTVTVKKVNNGTGYIVAKAALQSGESMVYDGAKWATYTAAGEVKTNSASATTSSPGAKNGATITASEGGQGVVHQTTLTCVATPVSIADDAGVAQYGGTGKIYDFPDGLILTLGAVIDGDVTLGTTGTIIATWSGVVGLGTAAASTGSTLTGTEADILQSTAVAAATAKVASVDAVSAATALTESGARWFDGTATGKDLFLNLAVADDATHTAGTGTFTGTITFTWVNLGDKA